MSGHSPLERQWLILRFLSSRRYGATVKELAAELDVCLKTIRRDLNSLQSVGFPIEPRTGDHGRNHWVCRLDPNAPPLKFDISEILGLYLGRKLMEPLAGTLAWDASQSAFRKIRASLADAAVDYLDELAGLVHRTSFRDSNYAEKAQLIDDLMVAIEDRKITFITYQSARSTEPLTYDVYPYGIIYHRGSLYLIAFSQQHDEIRNFKLDRISDISLEELKFQKPTDFDLREYLKHSLGVFRKEGEPQRVVIRFAADVARYVEEHHWHSSQKLRRRKDGSLVAELQLTSLEEVKSWVLSFGEKATVEEPEDLRTAIREECAAMMNQYDTGVSQ